MKAKTSYNIRLAEKKGVWIEWRKDWQQFYRLQASTAKRNKFRIHPAQHYMNVINLDNVRQLNVYTQDGHLAAVGVFIGFGKTFTYLYGASDYRWRQYMAPYWLHWQAILAAKKDGFQWYDFFGISPPAYKKKDFFGYLDLSDYTPNTAHKFSGITRFKTGFGGKVFVRPEAKDYYFNTLGYKTYQCLRRCRRWL